MGEHGGRMGIRLRAAFLDIYRAIGMIDGVHLPKGRAAWVWETQLVPLPHVRLLGWVGVSVDWAPFRSTNTAGEAKAGDRGPLIEQFRLGKVAQSEELPPGRFQFPPMPVHEMGEEPPGLLLVAAVGARCRHVGREGFHHRLHAPSPLVDRGRGSSVRRLWARYGRTLPFDVGPQLLEPPPKLAGRLTVVAVVALDRCPHLGRDGARGTELQGTFDNAEVGSGICKGHRSCEPIEGLEVFDRVLLDARVQRMLDDGVKVHEALGAEHAVDLRLAGRVTPHQPLECGWLIRCVVIDVHLRVDAPRL
jgi:hypothetical protein